MTHEGFVCVPFDKRMWTCVCLPQKFKKSRGGLMASLERDAKFVEKYLLVSFSPSSRSARMRIHGVFVLGFSFGGKAEKLDPIFLVDGGPLLRLGRRS